MPRAFSGDFKGLCHRKELLLQPVIEFPRPPPDVKTPDQASGPQPVIPGALFLGAKPDGHFRDKSDPHPVTDHRVGVFGAGALQKDVGRKVCPPGFGEQNIRDAAVWLAGWR